jgi:predicted dithiol-disulfide oxidoreductase (DUF899 family)
MMRIGELDTEGADYRSAREELLEAEKALRDQRERVAELRRQLPADTHVEDYVLQSAEGPVALTQLFEIPDRPLVLYQYMLGGAQEEACPMCTLWVDGFHGIAEHLASRLNFAVVAQAPIEQFSAWGTTRGWSNVRLLSSAGSTLKTDLKFQDDDGDQYPGVSVFTRAEDGSLSHFYSVSALLGEDEFRGIDLLSPMWHLQDLTPMGREEWYPDVEYPTPVE